MSRIALDITRFRSGRWAGPGYLAGEDLGLVTVAGAPARREYEVRVRQTRRVIATSFSESDGSWRVDGLDPGTEFDVIGRDWQAVWNDVIVAAVHPKSYA